jgi:hypothetical protein
LRTFDSRNQPVKPGEKWLDGAIVTENPVIFARGGLKPREI